MKNPTDDYRFGFVNFEPYPVRIFAAAIAEATATGVQTATDQTFEAAPDALRRVRKEELIDHSAREQEKLKLLVAGVDTLRDENDLHAGEAQPLAQIQNVRLLARETARVFDQ